MIEYKVKVYDDRTEWFNLDGIRHREGGPAIEWANGHKDWFFNGQRHRTDGPAIEWSSGTKEWILNGELHRVDGPAVELANGTKMWFLNGERHRTDGPAIEYRNGDRNGDREWWIEGEPLTEQEFHARINPNSLDGKIATIDGIDYTLKIV